MKKLYVFIVGMIIGISSVFPVIIITMHSLQVNPHSKYEFTLRDKDILDNILNIVASQEGDTQLIDNIRFFVYNNSIHMIDENYYKYYKNITYILSRLVNTYKTRSEPPHLACGSRSTTMMWILKYAGIDTRFVHVYTDEFDQLYGHTCLEVLNPETGRWELHDPSFDMCYIDEWGKKVSILQLVSSNLSKGTPVSSLGWGWELLNTTLHEMYLVPLLHHYLFECVLYQYIQPYQELNVESVMIINSDRFNISKKFPINGNMTIAEIVKARCGNPLIIINQGW